jgi:GT2 family glycosyltransferase
VVDNGSVDGTAEAIRAGFPDVALIINDVNIGVPAADNQGFEYFLQRGADYVLILNNDTVVDRRFLSELVRVAKSSSGIGMTVPKIYYYGQNNLLWSAGAEWRRFPPRVVIIGFGKQDGPTYSVQRELDYATGCATLVSRQALEKVGLLDAVYFMYQEDYDYSERLREANYRIVYVPTAIMWHKVSTSVGEGSSEKWFRWSRSLVRYYRRHGRLWGLSFAVFFTWVLLREIAKGNLKAIGPHIRGLLAGLHREYGKRSSAR